MDQETTTIYSRLAKLIKQKHYVITTIIAVLCSFATATPTNSPGYPTSNLDILFEHLPDVYKQCINVACVSNIGWYRKWIVIKFKFTYIDASFNGTELVVFNVKNAASESQEPLLNSLVKFCGTTKHKMGLDIKAWVAQQWKQLRVKEKKTGRGIPPAQVNSQLVTEWFLSPAQEAAVIASDSPFVDFHQVYIACLQEYAKEINDARVTAFVDGIARGDVCEKRKDIMAYTQSHAGFQSVATKYFDVFCPEDFDDDLSNLLDSLMAE